MVRENDVLSLTTAGLAEIIYQKALSEIEALEGVASDDFARGASLAARIAVAEITQGEFYASVRSANRNCRLATQNRPARR